MARRPWASGDTMRGTIALIVFVSASLTWGQQATKLPAKWEELTGPDFIAAIHQSQGVCMLPFGILEKHGPHLPIGTDLFDARYVSEQAAQTEYAVIFPPYYFGQIAEAKQEPGTVSYSMKIQLGLLQETTDEMARNGCKKIVIVNAHGGNRSLLPYFAQSQLQSPRDYVIYVYEWEPEMGPQRPHVHAGPDEHAGETETSYVMVSRPDLVHLDEAKQQDGSDRHRLNLPKGVYTGIWWYAKYPDHYAGDGSRANRELGEYDMHKWIDGVVTVLRAVKADAVAPALQHQFFNDSKTPLQTKQ
ncbi:MAG: creatininase family protein [Acidobacteria bacterium]|nr:creatininase family protein [Acidobacteriota bacterium]